ATKYSSWRSETRRGRSVGASMIDLDYHQLSIRCLAVSARPPIECSAKRTTLTKDEPMDQVVSGCASFTRNIFPKHRELFAELANGQRPEAVFITCADSRIDPNLVTQTRPGDLFIIRNAGNIVPPHTRQAGGVTASIEYGVAVLNVGHIVVCGHTHCGAMGGALNPD